jgi:hypothetical protein
MKKEAKKSSGQRAAASDVRPEVELEDGLPFTPFPADGPTKEDFLRWREEMTRWLEDQHNLLAELLARHEAFDMLGTLMVLELAHNPETYKETEHQGQAAVVEYVALTYLGLPRSTDAKLPLGFHSRDVLEASARASRILFNIAQFYASEAALIEDSEQEDSLAFLRYKTISHEMFVRNPAYPHHHRQLLEQLFEPFAAWLIEHAGFCVADLFCLEDAIHSLSAEKSREREQVEKQGREELTRLANEARCGATGGPYDLPHIRHLASLSQKPAAAWIKRFGAAWKMSSLGSGTLAFNDLELVQATKLPPERVAAATAFFSAEMGSGTPGFHRFSTTHELKSKPFLRDGENMLYVAPSTLAWAIQPRLEEFIQNTSKSNSTQKSVWTKYQKSRGNYLENQAITLFKNLLNRATTYQGLKYDTKNEQGGRVENELDGLIIYDTTLLVLEAKAGSYVAAAKRGGKDSIKSVLKNLIGDAHAQALRAKKYITDNAECEFRLPDKTSLKISSGEYSRILPVAVTLESLDIFNATLHEVAKTELLASGELPWAVSLDILRVISELNEFPSQFIHYLIRRLRLNEYQKFHAHDELDWYGLYLKSGLDYEDNKEVEEADWVNVQSHTDQFDAFYAHQIGIRKKKVTKPRQQMPHLFRQILSDLDTLSTRGYSEAILVLLEEDYEGRQVIADNFRTIRELTQKDGRLHNVSFGCLNGNGITIASAHSRDLRRHKEELLEIARLRKYQQKAAHWLTLLSAVDEHKLIQQFYIDDSPWEYDLQSDLLAAKRLKPIPLSAKFTRTKE